MRVRDVGAIIMSVFALIWWVVGVHSLGTPSPWAYGAGVLVTLAIIVAASRPRPDTLTPEQHAQRGRLVGIASAAEGVLILIAVNVLRNMGSPDLVAPAIAIIVGLHFIPLARGIPARLYYATAAALVGLGIVSVSIDVDRRLPVVCFVAAIVLWLTTALVLLGAGRKLEPA